MPKIRTMQEIKDAVMEHGNKDIAVLVFDPAKKGKMIAESVGFTLHELIEFIHHSGGSNGRHLSGGERMALQSGVNIEDVI